MLEPVQLGVSKATTGIVSSLVTSVWDKLKLKYNEIMVPTPEHFIQNTLDCYDKFSKIKCLARGQLIMPLKDIYVPLKLYTGHDRGNVEYVVDRYMPSFFSKKQQVLVVDTAGMGKSTLVKRLFIDIVDTGCGIPIFIELRRLSGSHSIIDEIHEQISFLDKDFSLELLFSFIKDGNFIFILDGYDEISLSEKKAVTTSIQDFINHARKNIFIMTSRQEQALSSFEGFVTFKICPLSKEEAFELLEKYDDETKETSSLLISTLKNTSDFDEFLGNPLLASMLLTAFSFKNEIPNEKHIFYRNVFDAYFNSHDLTKGGAYQHEKHSGLGIESFHKVLRHIGIISLKKEKIEFDKDDFIDTIEQALKLCSEVKCSAGDFFTDIIEVVPLFVQDGIYYRWAHKSLYEYFAAQNIYRDIPYKEKVLISLASDERIEKYYNLLDLYYEIDFATFRRSVIKNLLQRFVKYVEKGNPLTEEIIRRRQCTFSCQEYFVLCNDSASEGVLGEIAGKVHSHSGYNGLIYTLNAEHSLYLFRNMDPFPDERLIGLLASKKHSCVFLEKGEISISHDGFVQDYVYQVNENIESQKIDKSMAERILLLLETLEYHLDYKKSLKELRSIEEDISTVNSFTKELFS